MCIGSILGEGHMIIIVYIWFVEIVRTQADHPPCQPTIAAQLLLDGCKIEPYTIIIMGTVV
jgi:hypothetical protein